MKPAGREHTPSALQAWVRALSATASIGAQGTATLPQLIEQLGERFAAAPALLSTQGQTSYLELAGAVRRYARWGIEQCLEPGDVVGLLMHNDPEYVALWLGLTRIGVVVALLNTHLRPAALAHCICIVRARGIIVGRGLAATAIETRGLLPATLTWWSHGHGDTGWPRMDLQAAAQPAAALGLDEGAAPEPQQRALYIYTSGTTGLPKAANISHRRVMQWAHWFAGMMDVHSDDRMYDCLPMYHSIGGVVATGALLVAGGSVVVRERFSARDFWHDVVQQRCTLFQYIGELCRYLLLQPPDALETQHALRLCCGNGLRRETWVRFQERFGIPQILEYYAATEANFSLYNCEGRPGAVGRIPPFLSHRMRVALVRADPATAAVLRDASGRCERVAPGQAGEAIAQVKSAATDAAQAPPRASASAGANADTGAGAEQFEGYADPAASEHKLLRDVFEPGDTWYRSGDLMRQDEQGFFYFVDRLGDTFRWKGENVSTSEVSAVLEAYPGVRGAAVYGVSVPGHEGRAGMAALVIDDAFDLRGLPSVLAAALPEYARPMFLRIVAALPMTATLKLDKQALIARGFDPSIDGEPLYFLDRNSAQYLPLDAPGSVP